MNRGLAIRSGIAAIALLGAVPALAQEEMYPGQRVQVNPAAGGSQVLLYPDGSHVRAVPRLLQPGQALNQAPIQLHMPVKRKRVVRHVPKREPDVAIAEQVTAPVDVPTAQPKPPPKKVANVVKQPPVRTAAPPPRRTQTAAAQPNTGLSFTFDGSQPDYAAQVQREAEAQKASRTAALTESPSSGGNSSNLARRSQIIFAAGAPAPAANALDAIKMLGGDLSSALQAGAERIQLQAYGGPRNDKSSDSRRLSLKRAIAIRQILISAGVPGTKIDVRAMGGADAGPPDRVDVFVRS